MKSLLRLGPFLRPYQLKIFLTLFLLLCLTAIDMVFPILIRQVIDVGLTASQTRYLVFAALVIIGLGLLKSLINAYQRYQTEAVSNKIAYDLRNRLYDHIQHQPFTFFDHNQSGQLISRCIEDVRSIQGFAGQGVLELIRVGLLTTGISIILFTNNARLAFIALLPLIPMIYFTAHFGQRLGRFFLAVDNALGDVSSRLQENISGVQVVRAFAREAYETELYKRSNQVLFKARLDVMAERAKIMPTTTLLITIGTILILWFGGQMVLNGEITVGQLVEFNSYMLLLSVPVMSLDWLINAAGEASAGAARAMEILDRKPEIQSPPDAPALPRLRGEVIFKDVSFNYAREGHAALHHIDFTAAPNQVVALIGLTGSGKTTLVNLIPRFYDISDGQVLIDGVDNRQVDLVSLRRQIGIVLQTSLLFSATIQENIAYGRPEATLDEVVAAAKAAQADDFIRELPKGYETVVGERGITLSGGQRQRVAIARALLINPRILILDDSTSSVDTQTEDAIQVALTHLMEGRTTFIIAQRLSSVRRADLILVLDQGRIVERGTHATLLQKDGLYRQIYDLQLRDQEHFQEEMEAADR